MTERKELIYKELSYKICGFLFYVHNKLGRFGKEKNYADALEIVLKESGLPFTREETISSKIISTKINLCRSDFLVDGKVLVELKAKNFIAKEDHLQVLNYLKLKGIKLGLLANFREKYLRPRRIINSLVN